MNILAATALTLGVFACDRNSDKASQTNTTSASQTPEEPTSTPQFVVPPSGDTMADAAAQGAGAVQTTRAARGAALSAAKDGGTSASSLTTTTDAGPYTGGVAPGHIMFPPEKAVPGTGEPSSNGSHDMGSGAPAGRR